MYTHHQEGSRKETPPLRKDSDLGVPTSPLLIYLQHIRGTAKRKEVNKGNFLFLCDPSSYGAYSFS